MPCVRPSAAATSHSQSGSRQRFVRVDRHSSISRLTFAISPGISNLSLCRISHPPFRMAGYPRRYSDFTHAGRKDTIERLISSMAARMAIVSSNGMMGLPFRPSRMQRMASAASNW
jgi:hypothetical protein